MKSEIKLHGGPLQGKTLVVSLRSESLHLEEPDNPERKLIYYRAGETTFRYFGELRTKQPEVA